MNSTLTNDSAIEYNEQIISKIKEMIEKGLTKLKSFVKTRKTKN